MGQLYLFIIDASSPAEVKLRYVEMGTEMAVQIILFASS